LDDNIRGGAWQNRDGQVSCDLGVRDIPISDFLDTMGPGGKLSGDIGNSGPSRFRRSHGQMYVLQLHSANLSVKGRGINQLRPAGVLEKTDFRAQFPFPAPPPVFNT
jgi:hypothetical protein